MKGILSEGALVMTGIVKALRNKPQPDYRLKVRFTLTGSSLSLIKLIIRCILLLVDGPMTGEGYGNENVKKAIGLDWPNNNSAVLYISLPSLQDYDVNLTYFHVFWSGVNSSDFLLLFLVFDSVLENLTPEKFTNIRQIKRD